MVKTVGIRSFKARLDSHLRSLQRGDVILVTDRGRVVAEIRPPRVDAPAGSVEAKLGRLAADGVVKRELPKRADAYQKPGLLLPEDVIDDALGRARER